MQDDVGTLLNKIAAILAQDQQYPLDGTLLYIEMEWNMVTMATFKDLGDHLLYRDAMDGLSGALFDLWYAEEPAKRWVTMQYRIDGDRFDVHFTYDAIDPAEDDFERRDRVLHRYYGNKRIVYPPVEGQEDF